jgi:hypothetical protein
MGLPKYPQEKSSREMSSVWKCFTWIIAEEFANTVFATYGLHGVSIKYVQSSKQIGQIGEVLGDDVGQDALPLQLAGDPQEPAFEEHAAEPFEHARPDDDVGDTGLVFEGGEDDAAGRTRLLAHDDQAGDHDPFSAQPGTR